MEPQLYDAVDYKWTELQSYKLANGRTEITLKLEPSQSFFVVFKTKELQVGATTLFDLGFNDVARSWAFSKGDSTTP